MRIAFVYDAVHPWETGGVQTRVWELAKRLAPAHDVHWFGLHYWDGPPVIEREGVTLHGVGEPGELYVDERRSIREALSYTARLVRPLCRASVDVIDVQEFPYFPAFVGRLGASLNGATMVMTWHEVWGDYWYDYLGRMGAAGKAIERLSATMPHVHLAVSERTRRELGTLGVANAVLSPNGISMAAVRAAPTANRDVDVLYAGRMIPEKNPVLLVRAMEVLLEGTSEARCLLVGEGPRADAVDRAIAERGLEGTVERVDFLESHDDVLGLMKAAEAFVLPSEREGFGITALEALACGTPVVTLDHERNAATELVDDGETGALCSASPGSLASAIERARSGADPEACVAAAERYEWDRIAEDVEEIYAGAI